MSRGLVWFRNDLRLEDNPAWASATRRHDTVAALFVVDDRLWGDGIRTRQLAAHLRELDRSLGALGGRLLIRRGNPVEGVAAEAARRDATVYLNRDVTPYAVDRDAFVAERVDVVASEGRWIHPPGAITTGAGDAYRVFTPYHRSWSRHPWDPWPEPGSAVIEDDAGEGVPAAGDPMMEAGEGAALERLAAAQQIADRYQDDRDRPDLAGTTGLSADLKFGTIAARRVAREIGDGTAGRRELVRQLAWRDFWAQIMAAHPHTATAAMRPEYDRIEWRDDPDGLDAWKRGATGYPIVDAAMRQLRAEGWVHGRLRMIAASFLVKDLLIDWRLGERWFRRLLVDGDPSQNIGNWQWVAGTGADAAPYFRIFNPVSQGRRFDPEGNYVRRWVPELSRIPNRWLHAPWEAGPLDLAEAGVVLGIDYPVPIVDHAEARADTLEAYRRARGG